MLKAKVAKDQDTSACSVCGLLDADPLQVTAAKGTTPTREVGEQESKRKHSESGTADTADKRTIPTREVGEQKSKRKHFESGTADSALYESKGWIDLASNPLQGGFRAAQAAKKGAPPRMCIACHSKACEMYPQHRTGSTHSFVHSFIHSCIFFIRFILLVLSYSLNRLQYKYVEIKSHASVWALRKNQCVW